MLSFLRRLFQGAAAPRTCAGHGSCSGCSAQGPADDLACLATDATRRPEFVQTLARHGVYLLVRAVQDDPEGATDEFVEYLEDDIPVFPLFSSLERAVRFVQGRHRGEAASYQCLVLGASFLLNQDFLGKKLLLNPASDAETEITAEDLIALQGLVA